MNYLEQRAANKLAKCSKRQLMIQTGSLDSESYILDIAAQTPLLRIPSVTIFYILVMLRFKCYLV